MYLSPSNRALTAAALFMLCWSTSALAAATVSVSPTGELSYTVDGTGMESVAGIQLDITYDATSLNTPTAVKGSLVSGAVFAANTTRPGFIKIAIISTRPFSGSGQIASISFAAKTGSGGITSVISNMIDREGASLASTTGTQPNEAAAPAPQPDSTPGVPLSQTPQVTQTGQPGTTSTTAYPGSVTLPSDQQQRADVPPVPSSTDPAFTGEPVQPEGTITEQTQPSGTPAVEAKTEETPQYVVYKGIIDRFRTYSGSKSLPALSILFDKKVAQTIHQEPAILLSDGQSRATLTIDIPARITSSPNFAANGGTLVSFKQDKLSKSRWTVEILPKAGAIKVTVTIIAGAEEFEYPLTVAPPVKTVLTLDGSGWDRFIKEVGTTTATLHDLNADGVRDYVDEFIFVANHLAGKSAPAKPAVPSKTPAH